MGERKGVNKYYPPDFDYKKHGSLDKYHNSHPLRERAKKLGEGILIIRFEMPYNIWCNGCNKHIGMGVRYNSEKIKVGNYYTTPVYKFKMKCHLCPQYFEIQTDPANCEYVILSGARRKEERWNAKDNEQIEMTDHLDKKKLATDAMFKLEHNVKDQKKLINAIPTLGEIQDIQEEKKDDYILNKVLRKKFRDKKKSLEATAKQDQALLDKSSLDIKLLPEHEQDKNLAKLLKYDTVKSLEQSQDEARKIISTKPVLESTSSVMETKKVASKLPKSLGSALMKTIAKPNLWDVSTTSKPAKRTISNSDPLKTLGIKLARKKSSESLQKPASVGNAQKSNSNNNSFEEKTSLPSSNTQLNNKDNLKNDNLSKSLVAYDSESSSDSDVSNKDVDS
uniref:coiled-coil domain-containing protein 130-like n=1 Tax=Styela clava TaxID=7725 RepID=UPI00193A2CF2|nr:coiled-coil domain-containing protein 130-like [Styela clava]